VKPLIPIRAQYLCQGFERAFPDFWEKTKFYEGFFFLPYNFIFPIVSTLEWMSTKREER